MAHLGEEFMTDPSTIWIVFLYSFTEYSKNVKVIILINSFTFKNSVKVYNPIKITYSLNFDLLIVALSALVKLSIFSA